MAFKILNNFKKSNTKSYFGFLYKIYSTNVAKLQNSVVLKRNPSTERLLRQNLTPCTFILAGCGLYYFSTSNFLRNRLTALFPKVNAVSGLDSCRTKFNFIADVVETSASSVVYIEIKDGQRLDFFSGAPANNSNGSGFIVKSDGLILTNAHVVMNRPRNIVQVKLSDGRLFQGQVEDIDIKSDLATVRINAQNLPVMKLGSSNDLRPGEWVVAIGSPLSLSNTITAGVVSSPHRLSTELGLRNKDMEYIQTDASITFGNSGGPLVNLNGEAIGINAMKVTAGISFAIPIDYAKDFLKKSEERKKVSSDTSATSVVRKRYLGVTTLTLTPDIVHELHTRYQDVPIDLTHGVLVWNVILGSPAYDGGLRPGDVITEIDTNIVKNVKTLYEAVDTGKSIKMKITRRGQVFNLTVTPEETQF